MAKICNTCGATNPDDATVCSECGMDLTTVQQTQASVEQKPEEIQQQAVQEIHTQAEIISSSTSATTPKPKAKLIKKSAGGLTTEEFVIYGTDVVIGRFSSETGPVDIDFSNIPEANYVSRKHCSIYEKNGVWYIKDLGSTNGVFVNRKKISDETQLNDGDEVALGNALFVFKIETEK